MVRLEGILGCTGLGGKGDGDGCSDGKIVKAGYGI